MRAGALLYVPGHRTDFLAKCASSAASAFILDLEDGVPRSEKGVARENIVAFLTSTPRHERDRMWVRVNAGPDRDADLSALVDTEPGGLLLSKAEHAEEVQEATRAFGGQLGVLLESAVGIEQINEILSVPGVGMVAIGEEDLCADLDLDPGEDERELEALRLRVRVASQAADIRCVVGPVWTSLRDLDGLAASTRRLRRLGFRHRAVISPSHVAVAAAELASSEEQIQWARSILEQVDLGEEAFVIDDNFADHATIRRARRILELEV